MIPRCRLDRYCARRPKVASAETFATVHLSDGSVLDGLLTAWGPGWVELDGRRWDDVVFWEPVR